MATDPTTIRLADSFLLSDFMGCDSVYRFGYSNKFTDNEDQLEEGIMLAESLEQVQSVLGPLSISYGFISDSLSRKVVKYQDPGKPSYHRWDCGAAADICLHEQDEAPIYSAFEMDDWLHYSRMITYSESRQICVATRISEQDKERRAALYENRYIGVRKPEHVKYPDNPERRRHAIEHHHLSHGWKGEGHPTYHGGGKKQFQHTKSGHYVLLSDLLYKAQYVHSGRKNLPPITNKGNYATFMAQAGRVAAAIDTVVGEYEHRMSIVNAYERIDDRHSNWDINGVSFTIVPPAFIDPHSVAEYINTYTIFTVHQVRQVKENITRILCYER